MGVSPRRFAGWEPSTVFEYDADGRLVRSTPEPEWSEQDQGWLLALAEYRAGVCPCGCGQRAADTLAHEQGGPKFVVPAPTRCRARTALVVAQAQYQETPQPEALLWRVERR